MGFHAPQEAARILGEAAHMAREGQIAEALADACAAEGVDPVIIVPEVGSEFA